MTISLSVMLAVKDAQAAAKWYGEAMGAEKLWDLGSVVGLEIEGTAFFLGQPEANGWETPEKLEHNADADAIDEEYRTTPLGYAAHFGQLEVVKLLLAYGADPNKAGAEWARPLAFAERKGHDRIAEELRHAGAN